MMKARALETGPLIPALLATDEVCTERLVCPRCGDSHLHMTRVVTGFRFCEDGPGIVVCVSRAGPSAEHAGAAGLHGRRDVVHLHFECEDCPEHAGPIILELLQHKGRTLASWYEAPPRAGRLRGAV